MALIDIQVPDIGDFKDVAVIELLVAPGDGVKVEQSLITVESDKASMEIPSSHAGVVKDIKVKLGDKVGQGSVVLTLETAGAGGGQDAGMAGGAAAGAPQAAGFAPSGAALQGGQKTGLRQVNSGDFALETVANTAPSGAAAAAGGGAKQAVAASPVEVRVPDIGDFKDVAVIELLAQPGDVVRDGQSLITVESDKASMEIPSSAAGTLLALKVALGDKINQGDLLAVVQAAATGAAPGTQAAPGGAAAGGEKTALRHENARVIATQTIANQTAANPTAANQTPANPTAANQAAAHAAPAAAGAAAWPGQPPASSAAAGATAAQAAQPTQTAPHNPTQPPLGLPHASPSVRKFARELGVPLGELQGTGPKGRITLQDVQDFTQAVMRGTRQTAAQSQLQAARPAAAPDGGAALGLIDWPQVDFAKFGPVERQPLGRIKKISGANLHRNWVMIPHVTNHDDADITALEAFRVQMNAEHEKSGVKITMLAFLIKACVAALKKFPEFNASLDGDALVYKNYWHIGFAADTPQGLMVPVIKNADQKGVLQISQEMADLAKKAREGKLSPADMQGASFTISSLGGIGGRYFTPIINAPEVAILGVCRSQTEPVWSGDKFKPRLMLPLSLSWDHRVIDGAAAARFNAYLGQVLADFRRVLL